ncbi:MAG TPA: alpha/beta fold hydrolase [Roseiflexaceae bacterium]|nr:alpha/beta fold hydrolase [Roseiflexaceae bacterium]
MDDIPLPVASGFAGIEGARLYYEVFGAGQPLVLLHAGWLDRRIWDPQIPALASRFLVIRYDLRGFGRSTMPDAPYSDVQDLRALLGALDVGRATLVGLSLGGTVAIDFALANPAMVAGLALVGPGLRGYSPSPEDDSTDRTAAMIQAVRAGDREGALDLFVELWVDGPDRQAAPELRLHVRSMAAEYSFAHLVEGAPAPIALPSAIERLSSIRAPTLLVAGTADQAAILEIVGLLEVEIPGARRVLIPDAAHLVNLEQPERFNQVLLEFLELEARD